MFFVLNKDAMVYGNKEFFKEKDVLKRLLICLWLLMLLLVTTACITIYTSLPWVIGSMTSNSRVVLIHCIIPTIMHIQLLFSFIVTSWSLLVLFILLSVNLQNYYLLENSVNLQNFLYSVVFLILRSCL